MTDLYASSDARLISEIGEKCRTIRLKKNISQAALAQNAGVALSVVANIENGKGCSLTSLVKVLRALNALEMLTAFFEEEPVSPLIIAKMRQSDMQRQRASKHIASSQDFRSLW